MTETTTSARSDSIDPYDRIPYTNHAYAESHPDRLRVVALLSGWAPPSLEGARVLEVGTGRGGNLLAMAAGLPNAALVGVERSARQAREARATAAHAGVTNVTVHAGNFTDPALVDESGGFDFVIAHGVASWVSPHEREELLSRIGRWLSPAGVAYVSFNVLPGWYERFAARDWLRFCAAQGGLASDGAAPLRWLAQNVSPELATYRGALARVEQRLRDTEAAYLLHEYLAETNEPLRVSQLLEEAERAGLDYLGDAIPANVAIETLPESVVNAAARLSSSAAQELVDFVRCTAFRRALFIRKDAARERCFRSPAKLDAGAVRSLYIASRLRSKGAGAAGGPTLFEGPAGSVSVTSALSRAALAELSDVAPRALAFDDLVERAKVRASESLENAAELASEILDLWLSVDGIDLHGFVAPFVTTIEERPMVCPLARVQATAGQPITNRWHQEVLFAETLARDVLCVADGTRTPEELAKLVSADEELVRASLFLLARSALLVA
jgi:SAM-dependent methyltransferase